MQAGIACVAPFGRFIELGVRDIHAGTMLDLRHFANGLAFTALNVGPGMPGFSDLFREVLERFESGDFLPLPHEVFPLADSSKAFEHMARARHIGKIVIELRSGADRRVGPAHASRRPGLSCAEGIELFHFALAAGQPRIVVSTEDLDTLLARNVAAGMPEAPAAHGTSAVRPSLSTAYAEPQSDAEHQMAVLLARLLGFERIGRDDDFFELGGDSLLGTQFISQLNRALGSRLSLHDLFEQPRISALAACLEPATSTSRFVSGHSSNDETIEGEAPPHRLALDPHSDDVFRDAALGRLPGPVREVPPARSRPDRDPERSFEPAVEALARLVETGFQTRPSDVRAPGRLHRPDEIPLSFAQRRLWFLDRLEGPSATYNMPIALRLTGALDCGALEAALGDLVERHESLRTVFPDTLGVPRQLILEPARRGHGWRSWRWSEAALPEALAGAARRSFDLASEPPLRTHLFVLGPREHVLLLVLHHIAGDGWSFAPLLRDLARAYAARRQGRAAALACRSRCNMPTTRCGSTTSARRGE